MIVPKWCASRSVVVAALALALVSCGRADHEEPARAPDGAEHVRRIAVEPVALAEATDLTPSLEQVLRLGGSAAPPDEIFSGVSDVELLDDATLVVANAHFYSVERFSLDGTRVGRTGRMGKGPGEYSHISSVDVCDDGRLAVVDILQRRITLLSSDLEYESEVVLDDPHEESAPYAAECLGGGEEVLVLGRWTGWPIDIPLGPHRVPVFASVLKGRGGRAITLDQVGSQDRYRQETQDGPAYFGGTTRAAEGGGSIYVTDAVLPLVRRFGRDGGLVAVINTGHARQPVRGRDIDDLIDRVVGSLEERGASDLRLAETRRFFRGYEYPDSFPALRGILVDDRRRIWVESYPVGPDAPRQWHVLAPDGAVEARVTLPPSFDLKDVGDGLLVGVSRDPLGAQIIRVFRYTPRYLEQRTSQ